MWRRQAPEHTTKANRVPKSNVLAAPALKPLSDLLQEDLFNNSYGGSIDISNPLKLCILGQGSNATSISLPPSNEEGELLLKACEPASFGKGTEEVLDPEYRQALKLDKSKFFFNIELHSTSLLDEIKAALCPDHSNIVLTAEWDKLTVYTEGGFFKEHKDTPRDNNFIGTLVLVLPSAFEGGELIVQNTNTSAEEQPADTPEGPLKCAKKAGATKTFVKKKDKTKPAKKDAAKPKSFTFAWQEKSK